MLQLKNFCFNPFQENTYVMINEEKECWIVDPGMYSEEEVNIFLEFLDQNQLIPRAILNTHTHIDHILGIHAVKSSFDIPFLMHEKDLPVLQNAMASAMMFGLPLTSTPQPDGFIQETEHLALGNDVLEIRLAPGHSPGSIVFYHQAGDWVISGDVLFNGSIGRTDLPGGDPGTLIKSIEDQLLTLPDKTLVLPGHGPATTIGAEKKSNPFLLA